MADLLQNLRTMDFMAKCHIFPDAAAIVGATDIVSEEVDR